ncbi:MAG: preprotein translocase subunit YajC [Streptomycetaceae bacterium]|nr:preprotein translocase subunit YajC [Streptomycetaceae bacterium]
MNIATLLPFILILGVMLVMTRSAKNKQRQLQSMRDQMQPGSGVRTIGGMIALVKEVRDTTVLLEVAPGVHSIYVKNAIAAVLPEEEYDRLVHNDVPLTFDDALTEEPADEKAEAAADENAVNAADDVQDTAENTAETPETAETAKNRADGDK